MAMPVGNGPHPAVFQLHQGQRPAGHDHHAAGLPDGGRHPHRLCQRARNGVRHPADLRRGSHRHKPPDWGVPPAYRLASAAADYITGTFIEISGGKFCVQNPDYMYKKLGV